MTIDHRAASVPSAHGKLGRGVMAIYGAGQFVDSMVATALGRFQPLFLTGVLGLSGSLTGLSSFVSLTVDSVADPLIGSLSDNSTSPQGRRHPFMLFSLIPTALALGLLFSLPSGMPTWLLFVVVTSVLVILRFGHSAFNLPYVALGAEMSDDYHERTNIVAIRYMFSIVGATVCILLGLSVFLRGPNAQLHRAGYAPLGWTCAALLVAGGLICTLGTLRLRGRLHQIEKPIGSVFQRLYRDVIEVFRNRSFRTLFFTCVVVFAGWGVVVFLEPFALLFFWRLPTSVVQLVYLAPTLAGVAGIALTMVLARFLEKRTIAAAGIAMVAVCQITLPSLRILGLLPLEGAALAAALIVNASIVGVSLAMAAVGFQSMMADAADEHEHLYGTRREGLFFAGLNFGVKAAAGLGGLIGGVALDLVRFPTTALAKGAAAARVPMSVLTHLALIYGPGAGVMTVFAGLIFITYRLDGARHAQILLELKERRQGAV